MAEEVVAQAEQVATKADNTLALSQIKALLEVPGALRVITSIPREDKAADPDLRKAAHWVCHDVVKIQGPDERGRIAAVTAEGDACMGYPVDVLARLLEANKK